MSFNCLFDVAKPSKKIPQLSEEEMGNKAKGIIEEFMEIGDVNEYLEVVSEEVSEDQRHLLVKHMVSFALEKKDDHRKETGRLLFEFANSGTVTVDALAQG